MINELFEPMIVEDMNTTCKVMNIGRPVIQIMTEFWIMIEFCVKSFKEWHQGFEIGDKMIVKYWQKHNKITEVLYEIKTKQKI